MPFSSDPKQTTDSTLGFFERREYIEMNLKFAHAMLSARNRGEEHFTIGPIKNNSVLFPTKFPIQPTQSLISSSAATCVNAALGWQTPDPIMPVSRRMPDGFK